MNTKKDLIENKIGFFFLGLNYLYYMFMKKYLDILNRQCP